MLWDTHMHTAFSTDSETSPESMIKASIELGLGGICITDHMDYDYPKEHPEDEPEFILDTPVYFPTIQKLEQQYKDKIKIRNLEVFGNHCSLILQRNIRN